MSEPSHQPGLAEVARGVSWVGIGHVVSQAAWFGSLFFIAALVSPKSFGSVAIAMVVVQVAWLVVGSGTRGSFIVAKRLDPEQVRYALAVNVGTGIVVGVAIAALAQPLVDLLSPGANVAVLRVLALSVSLFGLSIVPLALLQKELLFKRHAAAYAGSALIASLASVVAGLLGAGVWALVLRQGLFQALLAVFAWWAAWRVVPHRAPGGPRMRLRSAPRPPGAPWFFALAVVSFVALNVGFVVIGRVTDVTSLGLYSLAFTIAFAPMTQFAWQVGKVLFPTAARATDQATLADRTLKAVRITALVLLPCVAPAVVLAPVLLPGLLGDEWSDMVVPFQILLLVGVTQAVLAVLREFLLGSGHVRFCARLEIAWLLAMIVALVVLVRLDGITGAALAHAVLIVPLFVVYAVQGSRLVGADAVRFLSALRGVALAAVAQGAATALVLVAAHGSGMPDGVAAALAALAGVAVLLGVMRVERPSPIAEGRAIVVALRARRSPA